MASKKDYVGNWTIVDADNPDPDKAFSRVGATIRISLNERGAPVFACGPDFCSPGIDWDGSKPQFVPGRGGASGDVDISGVLELEKAAQNYSYNIHWTGKTGDGKRRIQCDIHGVQPGSTLANLNGAGGWNGEDD